MDDGSGREVVRAAAGGPALITTAEGRSSARCRIGGGVARGSPQAVSEKARKASDATREGFMDRSIPQSLFPGRDG